jgi:hypothetical protein
LTFLVAVLLILAVTAFIVAPLLRGAREVEADAAPAAEELWKREKAVALLAITEADFDRATGKLSEDDYRTLRGDYEDRALHAMGELERQAPEAASADSARVAAPAPFCAGCGNRHGDGDRFCGRCGRPRIAA